MNQLIPSISKWQGVGLLTTTLLGTGVFILPQLTVEESGEGAFFTWLLLTLAILPIAKTFGELGKKYPHAGGPAYFTQKAFGSRAGHIIGLMYLFLVPLGAPAAIEITFQFVDALIPLTPVTKILAELGLLVMLFFLNMKGLKASASLQLILTITMIAIIIVLTTLFILNPPSTRIAPLLPEFNMAGMMGAAGIALWSFMGIEVMSHLASEFKRPERDFVPALMIGTTLVGLIYLACTFMVQSEPHGDSLAIISLFNRYFGGYGDWVIGSLGIASGIAMVNVYIAGVSRLTWSLAEEKVIPKRFARLNHHGSPSTASLTILLLVGCVLVLSTLLTIPFEDLMRWTNGVFALIYLVCMYAAIKLLPKNLHGYAWVGLVACLLLIISLAENMLYAVLLASIIMVVLTYQQNKKRVI